MINAMKKMMALLLAIVMVLLASPFAVLAEGLIEENLEEVTIDEQTETTPATSYSNTVTAASLLAESEEIAPVVEGDDVTPVAEGDQWTVTFNVGGANSTVASVTVNDGEAIANLPVPTWTDASGNPLYAFDGWHTDEACENDFTNTTAVTADITVYAKWVSLTDEDKYYVNFMNQDGTVVLITLVAEEGETVGAYSNAPVVEDHEFLGWSATKQTADHTLADFETNKFDFSTVISDIVGDSNSINLYAWYWERVTVNFISNGGTAVDPKTLYKGGTTTAPTAPTRLGYTFSHWTEDEETGTEFDFSAAINEDKILYAVWDPDFVKTTIVYMLENADDSNYTAAGHSLTVYAPTGSTIKIVPNTITDIDQTHAIQYCMDPTAENPVWENARAADSSGNMTTSAATLPDIYETYFQYASNSRPDGVVVLPNGSTVIQANYNRAVITLTFSYDEDNENGKGELNYVISDADWKAYNCSYREDGNNFTYSFTAKYGQNIADVWAKVDWVSESDVDNSAFYGWSKPEATQVSNVYTMVADLFSGGTGNNAAEGLKIEDGKLIAEYTLKSVTASTTTYYLIYARTTLPDETPDLVWNNKNYTIYTEACQMAKGSNWFSMKELDGTTKAGRFAGEYRTSYNNNNGNNYYVDANDTTLRGITSESTTSPSTSGTVSVSSSSLLTESSYIVDLFKKVFNKTSFTAGTSGDRYNEGTTGDRLEVLLYDRVKLDITLHGNDDKVQDTQKLDSYLYGEKIYDEDTDFIKTTENNLSKSGYTFAGWYTTSNFVDGSQFILDENTRIYSNLELWAKWEPSAFSAEFYLFTDDSTPYRTEGFAEGTYLTNWNVPAEVQSKFVGWYYYNSEGKLVPFDFSQPVGEGYVDENGKLKLYGQWKAENGTVQYLPGAGGDNATQIVTDDEKEYQVGSAMVQLWDYKKAWPSGVPVDSSLTFVGWKAPNGAIYQPGKWVLVTRPLMQFEAVWATDVVTLTYDANGGEGENVTETYPVNYNAPIWDNLDYNDNQGVWYDHFTREGYELIGWDENADATEPEYALGSGTILMDTNKTLYAIWRKCTTNIVLGKEVTGNMGDRNKEFTFTVTIDGTPSTYKLKHGQAVVISDVPLGASITFAESDHTGYDVSIEYGTATFEATADSTSEVTLEGKTAETDTLTGNVTENLGVIFTNTNEAEVDTGILLDSLPYVLILAAVGAALVLWFIRKRRVED